MTLALSWASDEQARAPDVGLTSIAVGSGYLCAFAPYDDCERQVVVAGRWRGDQRATLASELGLSASAPPLAVLAAGWRCWKTGLADRLADPFAIAIFDRRSESLWIARDALGVEPVFYVAMRGSVHVAGNPVEARRLARLRSRPDPQMVADYLIGAFGSKSATFHQGLRRLPPGSWLLAEGGKLRVERYWSPAGCPAEPPAVDYVERFRALLDQSISRYLPPGGTLGAYLSGGLDSSAIIGALPELRGSVHDVHALTMTYHGEKRWADERYIALLRAHLPMIVHDVPSAEHDPFDDAERLLAMLDGPHLAYNLSATETALRMARDVGVKTLLHGHGGDEIVSYGSGRLNELALAGRWRDVWREAPGHAALARQPRWKVFDRYLAHRPERRWIARQGERLRVALMSAGEAPLVPPILAKTLEGVESAEYHARKPQFARPNHTERDMHEESIDSPMQAHAIEVTVLCGRAREIEIVMPFMDRALTEYSLALPSETKLADGYTRLILRQAMVERVPADIAWRRDKNDFGDAFKRGLLANEELRALADEANPDLQGLVNPQYLRAAWSEVERSGAAISTPFARGLWRVGLLARWLRMDRDAALGDASPLTGNDG